MGRDPGVAGRFVIPDGPADVRGLVEARREYGDLGLSSDGRLGRGGVGEFRTCFLRTLCVALVAGGVQGVQHGAGGGVCRCG
jgi:hypothetical protein